MLYGMVGIFWKIFSPLEYAGDLRKRKEENKCNHHIAPHCTTPQCYMSCLVPAAHHNAPSTTALNPYIRGSCSKNICQKVPFFYLLEGPFTMLCVVSLRSSNMVKCQYCNVLSAHQCQFCSYILPFL